MPRFMMLMIPGQFPDDDWQPDAEAVGPMTKYNEELTKAGVLLALDGLHPPAAATRVTKSGVTDGPFAEAKEMVGGYWVIQAKDQDEAVEWARRIPLGEGDIVEVRRVYEMEDFSDEVQQVDMSGVKPSEQP
jgi:hypothetical protein